MADRRFGTRLQVSQAADIGREDRGRGARLKIREFAGPQFARQRGLQNRIGAR